MWPWSKCPRIVNLELAHLFPFFIYYILDNYVNELLISLHSTWPYTCLIRTKWHCLKGYELSSIKKKMKKTLKCSFGLFMNQSFKLRKFGRFKQWVLLGHFPSALTGWGKISGAHPAWCTSLRVDSYICALGTLLASH